MAVGGKHLEDLDATLASRQEYHKVVSKWFSRAKVYKRYFWFEEDKKGVYITWESLNKPESDRRSKLILL